MKNFEKILQSLIDLQKKKLLNCAEEFVPHITEEDVLQPNDFPILEEHPFFRHEEGLLEGLQSAMAAFKAFQRKQL